MSSFAGLLNNAVLLLALGVIYDALGLYTIRHRLVRDGLSGLLVGLVGIAVMLTPWELTPGIFFDTRWVLLSLCGLFFGLIPTTIAVCMTVAFRLYQAGGGMIVGSLVIVSTAAVGLIWRQIMHTRNGKLSWWNLYLFGVLVQLTMLSCMFLMPVEVRYKILAAVALPILLIYPIGTLLLGLILRRQRDRRAAELVLDEHRQLLDRERGLLRGLINAIPDIIFFKNTEGYYLDCNQAFAEKMGLPQQSVIGKTDFDLFDRETAALHQQEDEKILISGEPMNKEKWVHFPNGQRLMMSAHKAPFRGLDGTLYGLVGIGRDTTEQWRATEEREHLQTQLAQARKIESVGQLAGGIAHDFNNMLAVILGQAELARMRLDDRPRLQQAISEIQNAAKRSSDLTRQLLAFARKQPIAPKAMDLNDNVAGMFKMLRRVIGEDIELHLNLGEGLWHVKMDSSQLDQILTNLCVNARDAIEGHGRIAIETRNVSLDEAWCRAHSELVPGQYVVISVSDNGRGMDAETRLQIFDPFFTTKKTGQGTGLGLATVYGIVKQNHGMIDVYSELDQGSVFKIYLPRTEDQPADNVPPVTDSVLRGTETILLVEDEESVLLLTKEMLESLGYKVLHSPTPNHALQVADGISGPIHLLLTDVVMPEINGLKLSEQLRQHYPELKVLFMSGYTADIITPQGVLDRGVICVEKPFSLQALSQKVREALNNSQAKAGSPEVQKSSIT